jgi:uncharacterized membrane protein YedE/YeeE
VRHAVSLVLAGIAGALFGAGLLVAGMTQPARVIGFLDVRAWDPTLAFVMVGAIGVYALALRWTAARAQPWFAPAFHLPARGDLDAPLIAGAAIFGVGWGIAGYCPGPGIVAASSGSTTAVVFAGAMLAGMWLSAQVVSKRSAG